LSGTSVNAIVLRQEVEYRAGMIRERLGDLIYGQDDESLEKAIGHLLVEHQLTLGTAESCTGGYLAHLITTVPGSSAYFKGSVVAYSNEVKQSILGVKGNTLEQHGAVSEQTVTEMVSGALRVLQTDLAIAISGVAGPGGGSPEKPVGTIWLAVGNDRETHTFKLQAGKNRLKNIEYSGNIALNLIRKFVLQHYKKP
jgi:nicotinamide-nucleotide amidase